MAEWWTYRAQDFLMFSPRTYWRLIELYNRDLWPWQLPAVAAGAALVWLAARRGQRAGRPVAAALAPAWLWVGWGFHWERYATINWGARAFAAACIAQALLLFALGAWRSHPAREAREPLRRAGLLLAVGAVLVFPLLGAAMGRPWTRMEVFGLMPEPTALATLGLLLATRVRHLLWLSVIPLASLAIGGATLWLLAN